MASPGPRLVSLGLLFASLGWWLAGWLPPPSLAVAVAAGRIRAGEQDVARQSGQDELAVLAMSLRQLPAGIAPAHERLHGSRGPEARQ